MESPRPAGPLSGGATARTEVAASPDLNLAVIGNCSFAALIDARARIVWSCLPRFDGDPVFSALVDDHRGAEQGFWDIELLDFDHAEQRYRRNSAVLETVLHDRQGGSVEVVDFAPRFKQYGRTFRPTTFVRRLRP